MENLKLLLLTILPAIALACIVGVVLGKHQLKKANNQLKPILSSRERIIYLASITVGVACLLVGFLYNPAPPEGEGGDEMGMIDDMVMMDGGKEMAGELGPDSADIPVMAGEDAGLPDSPGETDGEEADATAEETEEPDEEEEAADAPPSDSGNATVGGGTAQAVPVMPRRAPSARNGGVVVVG